MQTLFHNDFSGGWQPQSDPINGPRNALLKLDNLDLEETGGVSMSGGTEDWSPSYTGTVHSLFSRFVAPGRRFWTTETTGKVVRSDLSTNTTLSASGGSATRTAFVAAFDFVFVFSGNYRIRDTGSAVANVGLDEPTAKPTVAAKSGTGSLTGTYEYLQVNVVRTNAYVGFTKVGPISDEVIVAAEDVNVTPQDPSSIEPLANEVWIYRRGGDLDQWYRIKILTSSLGTLFVDSLKDIDALTVNEKVNINIESTDSTGLSDAILEAVGPINARLVLFTSDTIHFTLPNAPDVYIPGQSMEFAGAAEEFKWAKKVSENTILVGTNKDIYWLSGSFRDLPDGILDVHLKPLGIKTPPISIDADLYGRAIIYMSSLGWTAVTPEGEVQYLNPPLTDRLYFGETFEGYPGVPILVSDEERYSCAIVNNKLFVRVPYITGLDPLTTDYRIEVYDFIRKYWRQIPLKPKMLHATEDNLVIGFFDDDKDVKIIDYFNHKRLKSSTGAKQTVTLKTLFLDNESPRNRKDAYDLKLFINTGNDALTVRAYKDGATAAIALGTVTANGLTEKNISIDDTVGTFKVLQIELTGQVADFKLSNLSIDYDPRPAQITYLRIPNRNFGTRGRKRIPEIAIRIDTLGSNVTWTPILDGSAQSGQTVNTSYDKTVLYPFTADRLAVDVGHIITAAQVFEFYEEVLSSKMETLPVPSRFYRLPETDLGVPNKKRVRTIAFILDCLGSTVTFTPLVDTVAQTATAFTGTGKQVYFHQFVTDIFGIMYSGSLSGSGNFEFYSVHPPEVVEVLPVAKRFDQIGPAEFFRFGKVIEVDFRIIAFGGTVIPYKVLMQDVSVATGNLTAVNGKETIISLRLPKSINGQVLRIELGSTSFDFHRLGTKAKVNMSGRDTESTWMSLDAPPETA